MKALVTGLVCVFAACGLAEAALLDVTQQPPDITANFCLVSFDSSTGLLTVSGSPVAIDYDGESPPEFDILDDGVSQLPQLEISLAVDVGGNLIAGGAGLVVTGLIDLDGSGDPSAGESFQTLLTGTVVAFGYQTAGSMRVFNMLFDVTGGTLASAFNPQVGVILDAGNYVDGAAFAGTFDASFVNSGKGNADVFFVPEPASALLLVAGLAAGGLRRRRTAA